MKRETIKQLRLIKKRILAEPKKLYMPWFVTPCGTAGCIAGHAVGLKKTLKLTNSTVFGTGIVQVATEKLGITPNQAVRLFNTSHWPAVYRKNTWSNGYGSKEYAQNTAKRIEHFIRTGK